MEYFSTGIEAVDKLGRLAISGDVKPRIWQKTIVNENGKPQRLAMDILAEIVYWYRPVEVRDERTGDVLGWKKKFNGKMLQKGIQYFSDTYGESDKTIRRTLDFLEKLGVIKKHYASVHLKTGTVTGKILFIELITDRLYELTYPQKDQIVNKESVLPEEEEYDLIFDGEEENEDDSDEEGPRKIVAFTERSKMFKGMDKNDRSVDKIAFIEEKKTKKHRTVKNVHDDGQKCPFGEGREKTEPNGQKCPQQWTKMSKTMDKNDRYTNITTENTTEREQHISSIHQSSRSAAKEIKRIKEEERKEIIKRIRNNIGYDDGLRDSFDPEIRGRYEEMYRVMVDVLTHPRETIRINKTDYPYEDVKEQYWLLRREHLEYVAECMETSYVEVSKMTAYLQTALYNAPNTYHNAVAQKSRAEEKKPYVSEYAEKKEKQIKKIARLREKDRSEYRAYLNQVHEHVAAGGDGLVDID